MHQVSLFGALLVAATNDSCFKFELDIQLMTFGLNSIGIPGLPFITASVVLAIYIRRVLSRFLEG